jgi:hypothetical protein
VATPTALQAAARLGTLALQGELTHGRDAYLALEGEVRRLNTVVAGLVKQVKS